MKIKYYDEYTNSVFNTKEEAEASEKKYLEAQEAKKKKDSERASRAKEVTEALNKAVEARKEYHNKLAAFCKDYGAFHFSTKDFENSDLDALSTILDFLEDW